MGRISKATTASRVELLDTNGTALIRAQSDLTPELLDSFKPETINLDKLLLNYWVTQFAPPPKDFTQIA